MDVALATCATLPEPDFDAAPLQAALDALGLSSAVLSWDDPGCDWARARMTVLRSTWNYPRHPQAFLDWVEATARVSELWNPAPVVRWNAHKRYLVELASGDLPVTPTVLVDAGSARALADIMTQRGWTDVVVKPAVSAGSFKTLRVAPGLVERGESHLRELVRNGDALVQPYMVSVEDYGERALIWIDGELTHAVRKSPRFDGEDESVSSAVEISAAEAALADRIIRSVNGPLMYARIDVAPGPEGDPVLMELELIEPSLFFPQCPSALERFARAIQRRLTR